MRFLLDLAYLGTLILLSPWLVWRSIVTGRYRREMAGKLLGRARISNPFGQRVAWFHAVSVGEVNLLGTLVPAFRKRHPDWLVVISSATDTGLAEARNRFADLPVVTWPFDFSWAVAAAHDLIRPDLVVLAESELWPNFLHSAEQRGVPVVVINARMSPRSFRRLSRVAGLARRLLFAKVRMFAVQDEDYTSRLRRLGVPDDRLVTTGSIKYDGAVGRSETHRTDSLRRLLGWTGGVSVWLAGSTHSPEESIILEAFARLRSRFPQLRLILVPRHPDRFEEVARMLEVSGLPFIRRSRVTEPLTAMPDVVLLDTVGELGAAWGLADVGFTGGSLDGHRGGQSMIEPAGYGVPCVFGPHVWNFKDAARRLVEVGGARMVQDQAELEEAVAVLLDDPSLRQRMGGAAGDLVRRQQGATRRTLDVIDEVLAADDTSRRAA